MTLDDVLTRFVLAACLGAYIGTSCIKAQAHEVQNRPGFGGAGLLNVARQLGF